MTCGRCGSKIPPGEAVCPNCGLPVDGDPTVAYVDLAERRGHLTREEAGHLPGLHGWALIVERGPRIGMTYVLSPGQTTLGRHPESDIFLDDVTVSRQHCRLIWENDQLVVEDAGSTNGTYVNEARVDKAVLYPGDGVLVGRFHFVVARGDV
jgi:hypothetical protein